MSGYYFDLCEGRLLTPGHAGLEVDDVDAVERQTAEAATRIRRDLSSSDGALMAPLRLVQSPPSTCRG